MHFFQKLLKYLKKSILITCSLESGLYILQHPKIGVQSEDWQYAICIYFLIIALKTIFIKKSILKKIKDIKKDFFKEKIQFMYRSTIIFSHFFSFQLFNNIIK